METKNNKFEKINSILTLCVATLSLLVAIKTCRIMFEIYSMQYEDIQKQNKINNALYEGDLQFEIGNWKNACRQYSIADSLGSPDKRGYIKFWSKAYEEASRFNDSITHPNACLFFDYANQLYPTKEVDEIIEKCDE